MTNAASCGVSADPEDENPLRLERTWKRYAFLRFLDDDAAAIRQANL